MCPTKFIFNNDLFFHNFRYLKEKHCLSRRALARLLHMSVYAIEDMEKNRCGNELELQKLIRICRIFDVDLNDLISKDLSNQT